MRKFFLISLLTLCSCVMAWGQNPESVADLQQAVNDAPNGVSTTITLGATIDGGTISAAGQVLNIPAGKVIVLDLAGFEITAKLNTASNANLRNTVFVIKNEGVLTITGGGKIKNTQLNSYDCTRAIENKAGATLNLVNCEIIASKMGVRNYGHITISDGVKIETGEGTTSTLVNASYGYSNGGVALEMRGEGTGATGVITGGILKSHKFTAINMQDDATLTISGGEFDGVEGFGWFGDDGMASYSNLQVSGGTFDFDPSAFVAQDAYYVEESAGVFEVHQLGEPVYRSVGTLAEMQAALAASTNVNPAVMTLIADVVLSESFTLPHGAQMIVPEGRTFTVADGGLFVNEGLTKVAGTIAIRDAGFFSKPANVEYQGSGAMELAGYSLTEVNNVIQYVISTPMQLQYLSYLTLQDAYQDKTWNISLSTDINLPSDVNFEPISYINGVFDGQKHSISGLYMHTLMENASLFAVYRGTARNLTVKNIDIETVAGGAAGFCHILKAGSILENITLQGTINSSVGSASGFIGTCEQLAGDHTGSEMKTASDKIWFVNCVNDIDISTNGGANNGAFIGTVSGAKGVFGFYNCSNNGSVRGIYAGEMFGCGSGDSSYAKLELVAFTPSGNITELDGSGKTKCGIAHFLGSGAITIQNTSEYSDEYDPTKYIAVYDEAQGKYVAKLAGIIDNTAATTIEWNKTTTWTDEGDGENQDDYMVPSEADVVTVNNAAGGVVVNDGVEAEAKQVIVAADKTLTIEDGGSLTIGEGGLQIAAGATVTVEEGATLVVGKDGIEIADGGHLVIEATEDGGAGVVLVDPAAAAADARPMASVELIPDAYKVSDSYYKHRYIGIPLYFESAEEFASANWEREPIQGGESVVTIAKTWNNGAWQDVTSISEFVPFKGYALSNESTHGVKYTFKGKLVGNGNGTMNFAYGFNLFANSYTAPINIQTLLNSLSNDVKATIYMFKDDKLQTVSKADFAGFRTPKFTVIPSMQAFFVLMDDGTSATETVNYAEAVFNNSLANGPLYAPKHQEAPDFNRVRINIAAENGASDELYLIEAADYTSDFENGFDEAKFMNNGLNIYATTAYGRQATEITNDLNGTFVGVKGNGTYTLTFDELVGEEYQIRDLQTNAVVTMSEENTYTFTTNGENDARFVVEPIYKAPTDIDNVNEAKMFISNNTLYVSGNADIMIYAANGQLVLSQPAQPTVDLSGLASGIYTVRVANQTLKFVK